MGIEMQAWPGDLVDRVERSAEELFVRYGTIAGPARTRLHGFAAELLVEHGHEAVSAAALVGEVVRGDRWVATAADRAGQTFGPAARDQAEEWPHGPYTRCSWNPLHLTRSPPRCRLCDRFPPSRVGTNSTVEEDAYTTLSNIPVVPLSPGVLAGRDLIKVHHGGRGWLVHLDPDGTMSESPLWGTDTWDGEWGCDEEERLVLSVGSYQLAVVGRSDGILSGLEFHAESWPHNQAQHLFALGLLAVELSAIRGIKWISSASAKRLTRVAGSSWNEACTLEEAELFAPGRGWAAQWVVPTETERLLTVAHGGYYEARLAHVRTGLWSGEEQGTWADGQSGTCQVVVAAVDSPSTPGTEAVGS